jgi:hypothetical protein
MAMRADSVDPWVALIHDLAVFALPAGAKAPPPPDWQSLCTHDIVDLATNWKSPQNLGVGCRANRLFVIDLDGAEGLAAFAATCTRAGHERPRTFTVRTPHDGQHLYFRAPRGIVLPSTSGGVSGLGPSIDTRGLGRRGGGYVVAPGSIVDGRTYVVEDNDPIATLPPWLIDELHKADSPRARPTFAPTLAFREAR